MSDPFKPHLACEPDPKHPLRFPLYGSRKLDGIRVAMRNGRALTRSLKPVPNIHIRTMLEATCPDNVDGEIIVGEPNTETTYLNTYSAVMAHKGEPDFTYFVFDLIADGPFRERLIKLHDMKLPSYCRILDQDFVVNQVGLDEMYATNIAEGYEGAILKSPDGLYKFGRGTAREQSMLKVKPFVDGEATIVSVYEAMHNTNEAFKNELGRTERSTAQAGLVGNGMVGGFTVRDVQSGVEFSCAPGVLTHDQRREIWACRDTQAGKIVKYRAMPYGVKDAPRFPRFVGFRDARDMSA